MPKVQRKKRHHEEITPTAAAPTTTTTTTAHVPARQLQQQQQSATSYVSNVQTVEGEDAIDDILAEMAGQQGLPLLTSSTTLVNHNCQSSSSLLSSASVSSSNATQQLPEFLSAALTQQTTSISTPNDHDDDSNQASNTPKIKLCNSTIPTLPYTKQEVERIRYWNITMNTYQRTGSFQKSFTATMQQQATDENVSSFAPSFDVEMTRHFKIQALSSYLLDAAKGLKMPAFERWYVDQYKSTIPKFVIQKDFPLRLPYMMLFCYRLYLTLTLSLSRCVYQKVDRF
jgi:hypothetical protein